jgi:2'-5' RNA ligase
LSVSLVNVHATVFLDPRLAARVDELRARWDPIMKSRIGPHITVTYPGEIPTLDLMKERVSAAAQQTAPFPLRLGSIRCFGRPQDGLFVEVDDVEGGWRALRSSVGSVADPFAIEPHVTIVHPRTSDQGRAAWVEFAGHAIGGEAKVEEVAVTAFDGVRWVSVATFPLRG